MNRNVQSSQDINSYGAINLIHQDTDKLIPQTPIGQVDSDSSDENRNPQDNQTSLNIKLKMQEVKEKLSKIQKRVGITQVPSQGFQIKFSSDKGKAIFQANYAEKCFYISGINQFKVDDWNIYAESEKLTIRFQELLGHSFENIEIMTLEAIEKMKEDIGEIFKKLFQTTIAKSKEKEKQGAPQSYKFSGEMAHNSPIPYPGQNCCCWTPQGHLITVHNTITQTQKQAREEDKKFMRIHELNNFIFSLRKKNQDQQKAEKHYVDIQEHDDEFLNNFMQTGMKIISESKEDDYDYLNFCSYEWVLPEFQPQKQSKSNQNFNQQKENNQNQTAFIYLTDKTYEPIREKFTKLYKAVDKQDRKIVLNQSVEINIFDFSCYTYNVKDNVAKLHEVYAQSFKKRSVPPESNELLKLHFEAALGDSLKHYQSGLKEYMLNPNLDIYEQHYMMELGFILANNIHQELTTNLKSVQMNLLSDFLTYSNKLWNNIYEISRYYDSLYMALRKANYLQDRREILETILDQKIKLNIKEDHKLLDLIQEKYAQIEKVSKENQSLDSQELAKSSKPKIDAMFLNDKNPRFQNKLKKFNESQDKYYIQTTAKFKPLKVFPNISYSQCDFRLAMLGAALKIQSYREYCMFEKLKQRSFSYITFARFQNKIITKINEGSILPNQTKSNAPYTQSLKFYCSVCQIEVMRGLILFCNNCRHGGHENHLLDWFSINQNCPQCFTCKCDIRKR